MKFISNSLMVLMLTIALVGCKKEEELPPTSATITVKDSSGPISGMVVYVYDQDKWNVIGDDPFFANGQAASNSEGKAVFPDLDYPSVFNDANNNQNTMRFSAHYSINGEEKTKVVALSFSKGDSKTGTLMLN